MRPVVREKYDSVRDEASGLQSHVREQLQKSERKKFLEQLETVAEACRDLSKPQR